MLELRDLVVRYPGQPAPAVDGVSFAVPVGHTVGLVGESGSGKSTLARAAVGLVKPAQGAVILDGRDVTHARGRLRAWVRHNLQMVFQDPYSSFSPRMPVGAAIDDAIRAHRPASAHQRRDEVGNLLDVVGLAPAAAQRYPHEFSGGQLQRVAIARALAVQPKVLLLDEITASLDVSVQAKILNLLRELQTRLGLSLLYVSHDLSIVRYLSDSVVVLFQGRIVEQSDVETIFVRPTHPYTKALLDAVPRLGGGDVVGRVDGDGLVSAAIEGTSHKESRRWGT